MNPAQSIAAKMVQVISEFLLFKLTKQEFIYRMEVLLQDFRRTGKD